MCTTIKTEQYTTPRGSIVDFDIPCFDCAECDTGVASIDDQLVACAECLRERIVFHPVNPDNPIVLIWEPAPVLVKGRTA